MGLQKSREETGKMITADCEMISQSVFYFYI